MMPLLVSSPPANPGHLEAALDLLAPDDGEPKSFFLHLQNKGRLEAVLDLLAPDDEPTRVCFFTCRQLSHQRKLELCRQRNSLCLLALSLKDG